MKKRWLMVLAVVGLLALLAVPAAVLSQSDEETEVYYHARHLWDTSAQTRVAGLLGISRNELVTRLQGGATLNQLAAASNVSTDTLVATILAPHEEMLDLQVKYGRLTAEQAQLALETVTARVQALVQTTFAAAPTWGPGTGPYCPMMGQGMMGEEEEEMEEMMGQGMMGGMMGPGMMGQEEETTPPTTRPRLNTPGWGKGGGTMGGGMRGGWDW